MRLVITRRRALFLAVAMIIVLLALLPAVRLRIKAGASVLETFGISVPRPFEPHPAPATAVVGGVTGLLYSAGDGRPILIVPGATPEGVEDSRVNAVARALVRSDRTVFIPELELYQERFTSEDIEALVAVIGGLAEQSGQPITVVGFSYGGSFSLLAAADPRIDGQLSRVATLGAYYDLVGVLQAVTTGGSLIGDQFIPWDGHPLAKEILAERSAQLLPEQDSEPLIEALEGRVSPDELSSGARSLYDLLVNEDPHQTDPLVDRLPPGIRALIEEFSPSQVADQIDVPVRAMHSTDDPTVPYAELLRLEAGMPHAKTDSVELFRHVDFDPSSAADWRDTTPDLLRLWSFTTWILAG